MTTAACHGGWSRSALSPASSPRSAGRRPGPRHTGGPRPVRPPSALAHDTDRRNYVVLQDETRAELYIDAREAAENKALFDALHAERLAIEADFGGALSWQRLDDKRASRISVAVPGGWADNQTWALRD